MELSFQTVAEKGHFVSDHNRHKECIYNNKRNQVERNQERRGQMGTA